VSGLWENKIQKIIYDYLTKAGPVEVDPKTPDKLVDLRCGYHRPLGHSSKSDLYDVLGYVDKDAEKWYASWKRDQNKVKVRDTIQNVDIYNGLFD
jgi:hypothetical protein